MAETASRDRLLERPLEGGHRPLAYRDQLNSEGSPSEMVSAGYRWQPGGELAPPR